MFGKLSVYRLIIKRVFDLLLSMLLILLLLPVFIILYFLIYSDMGAPVLFTQTRSGQEKKGFKIYKFRTMRDGKEYDSDEERITPLGDKLRRWSLDELPQLFNVFKGDMSLVGPRPLLMEYLELYTDEQARRHDVHPGITGWAQVNGRNNLSWEEKFEFDAWYVDNLSFGLDIKILWMTIGKLFSREGINQPGSVTAEKFTGTPR